MTPPRFRFLPGVTVTARQDMIRTFGLDASDSQWLDAVLCIIDQRVPFLHPGKRGTEWYRVELAGFRADACWAPDTAVITTVRKPREDRRPHAAS